MTVDDHLRYRTVSVQIGRYPTSLWWAVIADSWDTTGSRTRRVVARGTTPVPEEMVLGMTIRQAAELVLCGLAEG